MLFTNPPIDTSMMTNALFMVTEPRVFQYLPIENLNWVKIYRYLYPLVQILNTICITYIWFDWHNKIQEFNSIDFVLLWNIYTVRITMKYAMEFVHWNDQHIVFIFFNAPYILLVGWEKLNAILNSVFVILFHWFCMEKVKTDIEHRPENFNRLKKFLGFVFRKCIDRLSLKFIKI